MEMSDSDDTGGAADPQVSIGDHLQEHRVDEIP